MACRLKVIEIVLSVGIAVYRENHQIPKTRRSHQWVTSLDQGALLSASAGKKVVSRLAQHHRLVMCQVKPTSRASSGIIWLWLDVQLALVLVSHLLATLLRLLSIVFGCTLLW